MRKTGRCYIYMIMSKKVIHSIVESIGERFFIAVVLFVGYFTVVLQFYFSLHLSFYTLIFSFIISNIP